MKDFALNRITHDLEFKNNDLFFVDGLDAVVQHIKIRLLFYSGEWFLDTSRGVPFYSKVTLKMPDLPLIESIFKNTIRKTEHVISIILFSMTFDRATRKLFITFQAETDYGKTPVTMERIL